MASPPRRLLALLVLVLPLLASAGLVLEDGYAVSTAADLNPRPPAPASSGAHPYELLPRPHAGDLVLLDSTGSALYTLALPLSPAGSEPRRLAGGGRAGFDDGGPGAAAFDRPRSVAVDGADNVYVADRANGAVRKITPSGFTTTIAGGHSSGNGHKDGPAQNATFSQDFELVYVPKICALLVADRGNRLIRQINLKPEDCKHATQTGLGTTFVSIIAILCALFGSAIGFLFRHFYPINEVSINRFFSRIRKQYKRTQRKATLISFSDIKSVVANSMLYTLLLKLFRVSLGYLTVVLPSVRLEQGVPCKPSPSLLDLDKNDTTPDIGLDNKALPSTEHFGDFISFDGDTDTKEGNESAFDGRANTQEDKESSFDSDLRALLDNPLGSFKKIDNMIEANLSDFSGQEKYCSSDFSGQEKYCSSTVNCSGVSRRGLHGDSKVL